ncbi:MAG: 3TM-type holin [Methylicorpusculum sp.]|uniref:3TM-type holin n=1 Tax=Methylicorpusculum sp. TaxID=2713644 RepID=UPI002726F679|nr:3TM-type holin [Methylicorpusculum sp.]MDO8940886.1 3TM-type holin [Methylicorpusculum sp.]MDP2202423.1 3TM-type holin [Methylicorpusculum sp.]
MFGIDAIAGLVSTAVDKIWPDANIAAQANADALKQELTKELTYTVGQLEINKMEAAHPSLFVAGWRPAVGWMGALGYGYEFLLRPIANGIAVANGLPPIFPGVEMEALTSLLFGLLGLGTLRTVEKVKGVARHQ